MGLKTTTYFPQYFSMAPLRLSAFYCSEIDSLLFQLNMKIIIRYIIIIIIIISSSSSSSRRRRRQ